MLGLRCPCDDLNEGWIHFNLYIYKEVSGKAIQNKMKDKNEQEIDRLIKLLEKYPDEFLELGIRLLKADNSNIYAIDFLANAVINRAISLIKGFIILAKNDNYLTAVSLIRLQLDNALRFFASTLVKDKSEFIGHFIDGKAIKDYKDIYNKNLTDNYLAKKLNKFFPGTEQLYNNTCAFIHLSNRHLFPTITEANLNNRSVDISIGNSNNFKINEKIDFITTMIEVSKLVIIVIDEWIYHKNSINKNP